MVRIVSSGKALHSPEYHEKKKKEKRFRLGAYLVVLVIIITIPVLLLHWQKFRVAHITVSGNVVVPSAQIKDVVQETISRNLLWLLPRNNDLLIPRGTITRNLESEIYRIKNVTLKLMDSQTLEVAITEREPFALYCENLTSLQEASNCYFLDEKGFIFARAPDFSGNVYFIYSKEGAEGDPLGQNYLEVDVFLGLRDFVQSLGNLNIDAKSLGTKVPLGNAPGRYTIYLASGGKIFWDMDEDIALVRSNLESFMLSSAVLDETDFLKRVEYIDLTVANKVFYKLQVEN